MGDWSYKEIKMHELCVSPSRDCPWIGGHPRDNQRKLGAPIVGFVQRRAQLAAL